MGTGGGPDGQYDGAEADDLLCSRNARPGKDGEGAARCPLARRTRTVKLCSFDFRIVECGIDHNQLSVGTGFFESFSCQSEIFLGFDAALSQHLVSQPQVVLGLSIAHPVLQLLFRTGRLLERVQ